MTSGSGTSPSAATHKRTSSLSSSAPQRLQHHPVRSPTDRHSSLSKSQSPSPERTRKRANSSRSNAVNGHSSSHAKTTNGDDLSEADTEILSDAEPAKTKVKKKAVKSEPKDDADSSSATLKTSKSDAALSNTISRASSVNGEASTDKKDRKLNGENGHVKALLKDKPRLSSELSKNSASRAHSADATTPTSEHNDRSRQAHSAEPRKRKFSDAQKPSKLEPPRQKPKLDEISTKKPQKRANSPPTPGTPGLRSSHRRSASTQSNLPSAGLSATRVRRDISGNSLPPSTKDWATSDMSSDEAATYPPIPRLAPPPRSGRAAYRAQTSPARTAPTGKRADKFGSTPLARACERGNLDAVRQAYDEAPQEIDQADNGGFSPLQKAALEGHADIVQFLLEKGCRRDVCSKDEQDTPLIDAVENGHTDVVKLLLDHGVNPHHQNKSGKRAIDAIDDDEDWAAEMRDMLTKAMQDYVGSESDSDDDNQDFPLIRPEDKNRTDLLYLEPNRANLLDYSRKGDVVAVDHFLSSVKPDNSHAVVAARAGHHLVLNLLLASAGQQLEKDPDPAKYDETPLIAAIGRGHLKVIKLLLEQDNFNPARRSKDGKLYYEIAEERRGPRWQTERDILKEYYDAYLNKRKVQKRKRSHRDGEEKKERPVVVGTVKAPSSSPEQVKEKKLPKKLLPPPSSPNSTKDGKRRNRAVVESSDEEDSEEDVRVRKKPMRERRASMVSKSSDRTNEPSSPVVSRASSGEKTKTIKREESRSSTRDPKDKDAKSSVRKSSEPKEKRHSTDSKISTDDKSSSEKPSAPVKATTPEAVREARAAEEAARKAEDERKEREAEEAEAREIARKIEEERLRKEKEEAERLAREERERREKAEREEHERRVAALPTALRVAVQKGKDRPLHFRCAKEGRMEEMGVSMQFLPLQTTALRNIEPACDEERRDELWLMNWQVVGILGLPSELRMTEFPDWERKPVTNEQRDLFLEGYDISKLAQEFRWQQAGEVGYDHGVITQALKDTKAAFVNMEPIQWVRLSDFEAALTMPEYVHLKDLKLRTANCRIMEDPDSAIEIGSLFDDEEPAPVVVEKTRSRKSTPRSKRGTPTPKSRKGTPRMSPSVEEEAKAAEGVT